MSDIAQQRTSAKGTNCDWAIGFICTGKTSPKLEILKKKERKGDKFDSVNYLKLVN